MHEMSLIAEMIEKLNEIKTKNQLKSITDVHLSIGEISGVDFSLFLSSFELYVSNTEWKNTQLHLSSQAWTIKCPRCGLVDKVVDWNTQCKNCLLDETITTAGKDFIISQIEGESYV